MAESNRQPTRCPCGFFGSSQTLGLCSKCYSEREQNRDQITAEASRSSTVPMEMRKETVPMEMRKEKESSKFPDDLRDDITMHGATNTESDNELTSTKVVTDVEDPSSSSSSSSSNERRGKKRKQDEMDDEDEDEVTDETPVQKNKKRCFSCKCRMDLAIREIGKCKCEYVFCSLHRLPEQHSCMFDHKELSRQEARAKMVVFKKHVGTALKRLDSPDS